MRRSAKASAFLLTAATAAAYAVGCKVILADPLAAENARLTARLDQRAATRRVTDALGDVLFDGHVGPKPTTMIKYGSAQ